MARAMSRTGMPSVMATMTAMPASAASMMASAAAGGGTKIMVALAPVFGTASATVLKSGKPSLAVPPLPGDTPPTMLVPYSRHCLGVEGAGLAHALHEDAGGFVDQDAHGVSILIFRATNLFNQVCGQLVAGLIQVAAVAGHGQVSA